MLNVKDNFRIWKDSKARISIGDHRHSPNRSNHSLSRMKMEIRVSTGIQEMLRWLIQTATKVTSIYSKARIENSVT